MHRFAPSLTTRSVLRSTSSAPQSVVFPASLRIQRSALLTALLITFAATHASAQVIADVGPYAVGVVVAAPASAANAAIAQAAPTAPFPS